MPEKRKGRGSKSIRVGKVQEDKSYRVQGGRVYDPDTGRLRKRIRIKKKSA